MPVDDVRTGRNFVDTKWGYKTYYLKRLLSSSLGVDDGGFEFVLGKSVRSVPPMFLYLFATQDDR